MINIAIDGPAGAGKSTLAKKLAKKLKITHIDTGAMYRAVTLYLISKQICIDNEEDIKKYLSDIDIKLKKDKVYLCGKEVTKEIRSLDVTSKVSKVASYYSVREFLTSQQRNIAKKISCVLDGRDIGSNVLVDADIKFYLDASADVRAERRLNQLAKENNQKYDLEKIKEDIIKRDEIDSNREFSPLVRAKDAILINTDNYTEDEVLQLMLFKIKGMKLYRRIQKIARVFWELFYRVELVNFDRYEETDAPIVVCANHKSFMDIFLIAGLMNKRLYFIAKKELENAFILSYVMKNVETIFIDRQGNDLKAIRDGVNVLKNNNNLAIFPEGTRVKEINPKNIKPGAAFMAMRGKVDILPLYIEGKYIPFTKIKLIARDKIRISDYLTGKKSENRLKLQVDIFNSIYNTNYTIKDIEVEDDNKIS